MRSVQTNLENGASVTMSVCGVVCTLETLAMELRSVGSAASVLMEQWSLTVAGAHLPSEWSNQRGLGR